MYGSGAEPMEGAAEVGATDQVVWKRGLICLYTRNYLCGSGTGSFDVWDRDMGDEIKHWEGFRWIPPQGGPQDDGMETAKGDWWDM